MCWGYAQFNTILHHMGVELGEWPLRTSLEGGWALVWLCQDLSLVGVCVVCVVGWGGMGRGRNHISVLMAWTQGKNISGIWGWGVFSSVIYLFFLSVFGFIRNSKRNWDSCIRLLYSRHIKTKTKMVTPHHRSLPRPLHLASYTEGHFDLAYNNHLKSFLSSTSLKQTHIILFKNALIQEERALARERKGLSGAQPSWVPVPIKHGGRAPLGLAASRKLSPTSQHKSHHSTAPCRLFLRNIPLLPVA